jgi:hypothetical protein
MAVGVMAWLWLGATSWSLRRKAIAFAGWVIGLATPLLATWAGFALAGAGHAFLFHNFLLNFQWRYRQSPLVLLSQLRLSDWLLLGASASALLSLVEERCRATEPDWPGRILLMAAASSVAGLWLLPVAQQQYCLILLPLLAVFAGRYLARLSRVLPTPWRVPGLAVALALAAVGSLSTLTALPPTRLQAQLHAIKFVLTNSEPRDLVLDGWRGLGVFRPHAWRYFFLHPEIQMVLPEGAKDSFKQRLRSGEVAPRVIVLDDNLQTLFGDVLDEVERHYSLDREHEIRVLNPGAHQVVQHP